DRGRGVRAGHGRSGHGAGTCSARARRLHLAGPPRIRAHPLARRARSATKGRGSSTGDRDGLAACDLAVSTADPIDDQASVLLRRLRPREVTRVEWMDLGVGEELVVVL